jgi:transposase
MGHLGGPSRRSSAVLEDLQVTGHGWGFRHPQRAHVRDFALMMLQLRGQRLEQWMAAVEADDLPELHSFVTGLRRDQDAVTAGLTLPHSSGKVEGHVNRIKMIKRQMYGRAKPDLLRKRILLTD